MSTTNLAIMFSMSQAVMEVIAGPAAAQNTATKLTNALSRCLKAASTGSFVLPTILTGDANEPMILVNDSANSVNVYPGLGEKINGGSANAPIAVAAGASLVVFPVLNSPGVYPSTLDWRGAVIT